MSLRALLSVIRLVVILVKGVKLLNVTMNFTSRLLIRCNLYGCLISNDQTKVWTCLCNKVSVLHDNIILEN